VERLGLSAVTGGPAFWRGRRVLLTGHTGFKGGWAARWLVRRGAAVTGLALPPDQDPDLWTLAGIADLGPSHLVDLRDRVVVAAAVREAAPEIVLHMAAQPLVRRSYVEPVDTFATNVMGTVNLLDALRGAPDLAAVLVVTSDKVYRNQESGRPFTEDDRLGGHDPYSASKAAAEVAAACYADAFLAPRGVRLATARGGNVIGGGDFSVDRLVPDIWRAAESGTPLVLRHPDATRPWQHVLDCLSGYFAYLEALATGREVPPALNFGPDVDAAAVPVSALADAMQAALGVTALWQAVSEPGAAREMQALALDPALARRTLGWSGRLPMAEAVQWTADWYRALQRGADMAAFTDAQIASYEQLGEQS
jgi:CDP-glucose 4,6-dehydratase